jgi:hypothetical protein
MSLVLANVETELKSRARAMGSFTASSSIARMRYALKEAAMWLSRLRDWDYLNRTETLTTTAGNLGPYTAPTGMVRFASLRQVSEWGYVAKDVLAPILSTDSNKYRPYLKVEDGYIYFFSDPGSGTLTLNYVAQIEDDATEGPLGTTLGYIPNGLLGSIMDYAMGDLWTDIPNGYQNGERLMQRARTKAEEYWHQSTLAQAQRGISPKGLGGASIDNYSRSHSIVSGNYDEAVRSDT